MLDGLLTEQIRKDEQMAGMLARYRGIPAFFFQKAPQDTDPLWQKPAFPRVDYNIDMRYDPERKAAGVLAVNAWASSESRFMPEDIEKRFIELVDGTFYNVKGQSKVYPMSRTNFGDASDMILLIIASHPATYVIYIICFLQ